MVLSQLFDHKRVGRIEVFIQTSPRLHLNTLSKIGNYDKFDSNIKEEESIEGFACMYSSFIKLNILLQMHQNYIVNFPPIYAPGLFATVSVTINDMRH